MNNYKTKVRNYFSRAYNSYDEVGQVQFMSSEFLAQKLFEFDRSFYPDKVLDLGCGTGYMTKALLEYYPNSFYTLGDISSLMLTVAELKCTGENFRFIEIDMDSEKELGFYDLIVSNFAIQWSIDIWALIKKCCQKSDIFAFTCLLDGSLEDWYSLLNSQHITHIDKKIYPTELDMMEFCKSISANMIFEIKQVELKFQSPFAFMKYLKSLGAMVIPSGPSSNLDLSFSSIKKLSTIKREISCSYKIFFAILGR